MRKTNYYNQGIPRILTIEEFGEVFGVGRTTVFGLISDGTLQPGRHFFKLGSKVMFPFSSELITKFMEDSLKAHEYAPPKRAEQAKNGKLTVLPRKTGKAAANLDY